MQAPMKPLFTREAARHFLEETVVHSMEGALFALLSALFTLAGAAIFVEDANWRTGGAGMTAAAPVPVVPVVAERRPPPAATMQQASYVLPTAR